mgnify:CR=1 FL=1
MKLKKVIDVNTEKETADIWEAQRWLDKGHTLKVWLSDGTISISEYVKDMVPHLSDPSKWTIKTIEGDCYEVSGLDDNRRKIRLNYFADPATGEKLSDEEAERMVINRKKVIAVGISNGRSVRTSCIKRILPDCFLTNSGSVYTITEKIPEKTPMQVKKELENFLTHEQVEDLNEALAYAAPETWWGKMGAWVAKNIPYRPDNWMYVKMHALAHGIEPEEMLQRRPRWWPSSNIVLKLASGY